MIVTPHFVYVHLHKSGGTFINDALVRHVPDAVVVGYHLPVSSLPQNALGLPVLGFVRNPWTYYVSWFSFQRGLPQQNHLFRCVSRDNSLGFKDTIRRLLGLESDPALLSQVLQGLPEVYVNRGLNLPRQALEPIRGSGLGFYSHLYRHMYGNGAGQALHIGCTESLRQDLAAFFGKIRYVPPEAMSHHIEVGLARNRSVHGDYRLYYDDELRQLVAQRDGELIRAYGYSFEQAMPRRVVPAPVFAPDAAAEPRLA